MTREIKFRGKDILTDKWVYGDLLHLGNACAIVTSYEEEELKVNPISDRLEFRVEDIAGVYPETTGQFTGLLDKNGKEIYKGDIMNDPTSICVGVVEWNSILCQFQLSWQNMHTAADLFFMVKCGSFVIGNIHDNPELLEGGAE